MTHSRPAALLALIALTGCSAAEAGVQGCALALGDGTQATIRIDERGRTIQSLGMDLVQQVGGSAHECSIGARRGDGRSRWSGSGPSTFISIVSGDAGPFEAVVQRYKGDLQLSLSAPGGDLATCGAIAVPGTVIVTPKPNGRCTARLPGRR